MRGLVLLCAVVTGCVVPVEGERAAGGASAPIDVQATWKEQGVACPANFVQLGTDDDFAAEGTDAGRLAICVHQDFCAARPSIGGYCAGTPKNVLTTSATTFWSDFLVDCPAVGRMAPGSAPGTATIRIPDANQPGGARVYGLDASSVHTQLGIDFDWEPCLTNPVGAGLRDPSCADGVGAACSLWGDALVECVWTSVDDRRGGTSTRVDSIEVLSRRDCASRVCEASPGLEPACQEDRALTEPAASMDESGNVFLTCDAGRTKVDVRGVPMCLAESFCAARAPGLYCDDTPAGVSDTRAWGNLDPYDSITPGALVVNGDVAVQCARDAAGVSSTTLFPCASNTCVGNGVGFGCVDSSCELRNAGTDLDALYWSGTSQAIAEVEGLYCSELWPGNLLDCQLVQIYDTAAGDFTIRLLPQSYRRCPAWAPICEAHEPGTADACVAATPAE